MNEVSLNVSQAVDMINQCLSETLPFMVIEGEVSSFKVNQNKFVFFDIKDEGSTLGCFMMAFKLKFPLEDGMKVRVVAQPKVTQWGKFSLTVDQVMPVGEGSLKKSFELLKTQLAKEGLFDESRKRALPKYPARIGVVSSSQAAGYKDFIKIVNNRWGGLQIILADVTVQGIDAPTQLVGALNYLNELSEPLDVIAVMRGGGSADDLAAFNHEDVVRAVALSRTPTIVGVGHEVDVTLCDLAADVRAATPSNVAEIVVPDKREVLQITERATRTACNGVDAAVRVFSEDRERAVMTIENSLGRLFTIEEERLIGFSRTLKQINPENVLKRGYALVRGKDGLLRGSAGVTIGSDLMIAMHDGEIGATVTDVRAKN